MTFEDFITGITFKDIHPHTFISDLIDWQVELSNTILPEDGSFFKQILSEICQVPKMSTFAIGAIINKGISLMPANQAFVNIGVWNGFTLLSGMQNNMTKICIGVDNFSNFDAPREAFKQRFNKYKSTHHYFYDMDYIDYFKHVHNEPIGFYLYDGSHKYEDQLKGLQLAEPFFTPNSIIVIDDTNWEDPRQATMDFLNNNNDYKVLLDVTTAGNLHPTFWNGIMILQKIH